MTPSIASQGSTKRMRTWLLITVAAWGVMGVLSSEAAACDLMSEAPWFWTEAQLVARTPEIFIGRVIDTRSNGENSGRVDHLFEVIESIKGADKAPRRWLGPFRPGDLTSTVKGQGRAFYDSACQLAVGFSTGQQYLVFRDSFHPKGYELIVSPDDAWLKTVRNLVKSQSVASISPR